MSTNSECVFFEYTPGAWYYALQDSNAPHSAWDWREHATCYGPFATEGEAMVHLDDNHPNPGGYSVEPYEPDVEEDAVYTQLVDEAEAPSPTHTRRSPTHGNTYTA